MSIWIAFTSVKTSTFAFYLSQLVCFFSGSCALFTGPTSTFFNKNKFKTGSHDTIHKFKDYFAIVFSVFNF